jgi:SAM-dependent methyltransferase
VTRIIGREASKGFRKREHSGFWRRYGRLPLLDIGYRGDVSGAEAVLPGGVGIELGDKNYDGLHLPFDDGAFNCVHSSHVLEHVQDPLASFHEWFRVTSLGGHLVTIVPHAHLYERRLTVPPSRWSPEHFRAFSPGLLLTLVEIALTPNTYRVVHLRDVDDGYRYDLPITEHPQGSFEIEMVIQRIAPPKWQVES